MMNTQAVLFDLGNTLVSYYRAGEFRPILKECLRAVTQIGAVEKNLDELLSEALELNREAADFAVWPLDVRLQRLFPSLEKSDDEAVDAAIRAFMGPIFECAVVMNDAVEVLETLRARGLKTGLVSNTPWGSPGTLWRDELRRHGLYDLFDTVTFCVDVGWRKPHPAPFVATLDALDVRPEQAAFIGDDPRWDVKGAMQSGLWPILFSAKGPSTDGVTVIRQLRELVDSEVLL